MNTFQPRLDILPTPQRALWPQLGELPRGLVLYGGTALALRLGHRASVDFDFFASDPFDPRDLIDGCALLRNARVHQSKANTLTVALPDAGGIQLSFFGGLTITRVGEPEWDERRTVLVASLDDLAARKIAVLPQRAEAKDYLDVAALLAHGISLERALGCAAAVYGGRFNPMASLKALSYFEDGCRRCRPTFARPCATRRPRWASFLAWIAQALASL